MDGTSHRANDETRSVFLYNTCYIGCTTLVTTKAVLFLFFKVCPQTVSNVYLSEQLWPFQCVSDFFHKLMKDDLSLFALRGPGKKSAANIPCRLAS